jgi:signal peptidase II
VRPAQDSNVLTNAAPKKTSFNRKTLTQVLGPCVAVLIADQLTKRLAVAELADGPTREVLGVRFNLFFNPGASFSMFADGSAGPVLGILALIISGVLIRAGMRATDSWSPWVYGVIAGGALGNFLDRLLRAEDGFLSGTVVDFIDLGWWPVFNVADSALIAGVGALFLITFFSPESDDEVASDG